MVKRLVRTAVVAALAAALGLAPAGVATAADPPRWIAAIFIDAQRAVGLRWLPAPGVTGYKVLRSDKSGADFKEIAAPTTPQYFDATVESGSTYYYVLQAVAGAAVSANSEERSLKIPGEKKKTTLPPEWNKVVAQETVEFGKSVFKVGLIWNKAAEATAYNVYRSLVSGKDYQLITSTSGAETQAIDTNVEVGKTYYYVLSSLDAAFVETPFSAEQKVAIEKKAVEKAVKVKIKLAVKPRKTEFLWSKEKGDDNFKFKFWEGFDISLDEANDIIYSVSTATKEVYALNATTGDLIKKFGESGNDPGQFISPLGTGLDGDGNLYVCDQSRGVVMKFSGTGTLKKEFELKPPADVVMAGKANPHDVAIDWKTGDMYISDMKLRQIWVLDENGAFQRFIGKPGEGPGEFTAPMNMRFDPEGNLVVIDQGATRIMTFKKDGTLLRSWGERKPAVGSFLFIGGFGLDKDGNLFVVEKSASMVQGFLPDGRYVFNLANEKNDGAMDVYSPKDVVVDAKNRIFIVQGLIDRISAFQIVDPIPPPQEEPEQK